MKVSQEEKKQGLLNDQNLDLAIRILQDKGYVVLEDVLPKPWVENMHAAITEELEDAYKGKQDALVRSGGHGGVAPRLEMPFVDPLIIENPMAYQIMEKVFGKKFFSYLPYGCNTTFPGCGVQGLHRDTGHLFPEAPFVLPPAVMVVNIPLVDFTEENGATEIWPGSHLILDRSPEEAALILERAALLPSVRTIMPAGSVVVRDMRAWHRGMPNNTDKPRMMLALVFFRQFCYLPDDPGVFTDEIPDSTWNGFSDRLKSVFRHHQGRWE
jgi:hypothetical protein